MANKTNIKTSLTIFVFLLVMVVLMAGATSVYGRAPAILLVSDCSAPGMYTGVPPYDVNERDNTLVWFLEGLGYTVDTSGMNKAYQEGQNPFSDPAKLAALDAADLVLVSRPTNSVGYDNDRLNWNELEKPLLLMNGYLTRGGSDNRWGWTTGGSADADLTETDIFIESGQETHPFVTGFATPISAFDWSSAPGGQAPKPVYLPNSPPVAGATVIGTFDGMPILMDVPAGTDFDANNTNGPYGVAGGRRVLLATWGYDIDLGSPYNRPATFTDFLTEDYLALFAQTLNELLPSPNETIYVDADAIFVGDGRSWPAAFKYLQDALTIAWPGDEIRVAEGVYKPDANSTEPFGTGDRGKTFQLIDGVTVKGGYAGFGEPDPDARNIEAYETILSGDLLGNDGPNFANNGENSYNVVTGSLTNETAVLDGFTITGGNANDGGYDSGGGMYSESGSPTLINCTFNGNSAWYGGGMFNYYDSSPTITNCTFSYNRASSWAGGMENYFNSSPTVTNCTFGGNWAVYGGGMFNYVSSPTMTNCTFSGNQATTGIGGGMYNLLCDNPIVTNCILWDNTPDEIYNDGSTPTVTYSDVQGGYAGTGNIDADPCFVNPDANDYHLKPDSPCIDAGDTTAVPAGIFVDVDGNPRVLDDPQTPDTGLSIFGVTVDMGAYEFGLCRIAGDINCDGVVDFKDVAILCNNWLAGTEP